jgi:hypothetical protein
MSARRIQDPLIEALAALPPVAPDAAHAARVRRRCRAALEQPRGELPRALEPAAVGTICAVYAWQIARAVAKLGPL